MKTRRFITGLLLIACLAAIWGVIAQRQTLAALQTQQQEILSRLAGVPDSSTQATTMSAEPTAGDEASPSNSELLRLRDEVTRLNEQRRALANVRAENDRLRAQAASRGTNGAMSNAAPQFFVRKAQAQMVGFSSPENTIQSVLWALQNRDFNTFLEALTPDAAEKLQADLQQPGGQSADDFFRDTERIAGLAIMDKHSTDDGQIEVQLQTIPTNYVEGVTGEPPDTVRFVQVNGQWKVAFPF